MSYSYSCNNLLPEQFIQLYDLYSIIKKTHTFEYTSSSSTLTDYTECKQVVFQTQKPCTTHYYIQQK